MSTDPNNPYSLSRAVETADRMLARYSSAQVASDMAHWHAMDHPDGSEARDYWQTVGVIIRRKGKA